MTSGSSLRLVTWNCRSGGVAARVAEVAGLGPDLVFLQECRDDHAAMADASVLTRRVNARKSLALATLSPDVRCTEAPARRSRRSPSICATVSSASDGRALFTLLGLWAHGPDYVADVCGTLRSHRALLRQGPAIVLGDLNSGTRLGDGQTCSDKHRHLVDTMSGFGLVSAYHAFHGVDHGGETHATYFHRARRHDAWHIDFCFVPKAWAPHLQRVGVGDPDELTTSDHRPVIVELPRALVFGASRP